MEAILAGMVEGVIVVDPQGRLQLVNDAARQMLKLDDAGASAGHYVETIRHPAIAELVAARAARRDARRAAAVAAARSVAHDHGARRAGGRRRRARRRSSCCTTSPSCGAPTRSAATSSPTSRTSCARR